MYQNHFNTTIYSYSSSDFQIVRVALDRSVIGGVGSVLEVSVLQGQHYTRNTILLIFQNTI